MKSIMQAEKRCYISSRTDNLEAHHIYGASNRKLSEKYGLWVWLTPNFHNEPPFGAHHNIDTMRKLQREGQLAFMKRYPELDFIKIFGRNYL